MNTLIWAKNLKKNVINVGRYNDMSSLTIKTKNPDLN